MSDALASPFNTPDAETDENFRSWLEMQHWTN